MATKKISQLTAQSEVFQANDLLEIENVSQAAGSRSEKTTFKKLQGLVIDQYVGTPTDSILEKSIGFIAELTPTAASTMELPARSATGTEGQITQLVNLSEYNITINQNSGEAGNVILNAGSAVGSFVIFPYASARIYDNGSNWIVL